MDALFLRLKESFDNYIKNKDSIARIEKAYFIAKKFHEGQLRRSGEPYITHPIEVGIILADLHAGPQTLIAALLHDVVEDTSYTLSEVEKVFDKDVRELVDGVTKLSKIHFQSVVTQAENIQKMLLAMAKDIRVVLIKIADRLHNVRTLESMPAEKQVNIARETLEIYAPIAHRLGIFKIKAELEDIALRYTDQTMYYRVANLIKSKKDEREQSIDTIIVQIQSLMKENQLVDYSIKGRIKNIFSIYKKMVRDQRAFEDIYDLLAIRIIVPKIESCYQVLGLIHANYTPIPRRFKDYISVPKPNMYQSLHTTLLAEDGTLFEVQIRTKEMDDIAEYGVAAHWAYKENKAYSKDKEQFEIAQKLKWYGELLKISSDEEESEDAEDFVNTVKGDILEANVYVFTPKGEVIELPKGATPIDFAYRIHTDVGHKMVGATVNNRIVTLDYSLKTGDIVSVKTNKNASGPSDAWLKIAKSSHAKHKIKSYLNKEHREDLIELGKQMLDREFTSQKITDTIDDAFAKQYFEKNLVQNLEDLYLEIGKGLVSVKTVAAKLMGIAPDKEVYLQRQMEKASKQLITHSETGIAVEGLRKPQIKLANCCSPVPGDGVIGFVSKTSGIVTHANFCPNIEALDKKRFISVEWATKITRKYPVWINITSLQRHDLLGSIVQTINAQSVSIVEVKVNQNQALDSQYLVRIMVNNLEDIQSILVNLKKIKEILNVERAIV
ncbi:MAG TPA: (p)ppGpp synthetase [Acholeplasmataceae bacterium]|nr:(p)ppGpp synthetase [Acholeplasmataceae bacterium]